MSIQKYGSINMTAITVVSHYELCNCLDTTLFLEVPGSTLGGQPAVLRFIVAVVDLLDK